MQRKFKRGRERQRQRDKKTNSKQREGKTGAKINAIQKQDSNTTITTRIDTRNKCRTAQKNSVAETREVKRDGANKLDKGVSLYVGGKKLRKEREKIKEKSIAIESLLETLSKSRGNLWKAGKSETATKMTRRKSKHREKGKNAKQGKHQRKDEDEDEKSDIPRGVDKWILEI